MSSSDHIPFALPDITEDEILSVTTALRSGWVSSGPKVKEFEAHFADFIGGGVEAVAVNSATAGMHLALEALGIGPGDEVLVPTWTFTATAEVVHYMGAEPILVDVLPESLNVDLDHARRLLTSRTRAIMPVHFAGLPVSSENLREFAEANRLLVVEDAAHAFPAHDGHAVVGSGPSAATVFSFYATKTITTGEGGMLVTRNRDVAARARVMRLHGISRGAFDRYRSTKPAWQYEVVAPGFKYNLTDPAAALGLVQLSRAREMRKRRSEIAARYDAAFSSTELQLPHGDESGEGHAWHLYVVRLPESRNRDDFITRLAEEGVSASVHFIPLHLHTYWRGRGGHKDSLYPVATREFTRVLSLPLFSSMSSTQVERVVDVVLKVLEE